jgi:peptidoglycan/xylan/chitin deacetylase (PgdA/CDA1 family)/SAM-dependent methyltransferase
VTTSTSVLVEVGPGGWALLRTADTIARQHRAAEGVVLVKSSAYSSTPLVESVVSRLRAVVVEPGSHPGTAWNAAARCTAAQYLVVLQAGLALHDSFIERCESMFHDDPSLAAVAPAIALRTADGSGELHWIPEGLCPTAILSDTRSVPPAFAIRRDVWESLGGFDETLEGLVEYEFWLRLAVAGHRLELLQEPLISREVAERRSTDSVDDQRHLQLFRTVLERHAAAVERDMTEVLVLREIRFGRLRDVHRGLLARRDADLEELDRLRTAAAHHRAYLTHHGRDAVDWGDLRRTDPVSRDWGYDRGIPIDRRYIDGFLAAHSSDVRGAVLEVQEDDFTLAFGGTRVTEHAILDIDPSNERATVLADLRSAPQLPSQAFDCIILTQTLHVLDDMAAALGECYRILKPGGVLLATLPSASRVCLEYGEDGDLWRMTPAGARALFQSAFAPADTSYDAFGNVLTNTAFLHGLACAELTDAEFEARDPYFPALTGVRAKKTNRPARARARGVVLLYHRIDDTPDVHGLGVPAAAFDAQLQWLRAECHIMPLDELLSTPCEQLPDRAVALTFDDGYEDNLRVAAPLLQRHQAPAAFFLTSRWLEDCGEYWWDTLERVLLATPAIPATLDIKIAGARAPFATASPEQRLAAHWRLHAALVHASLEERERAVDLLRVWAGGGAPRVRPMMADGVRQLATLPGVTIGAHSVNHLALPDQRSAVLFELTECQADLRRVTGRPIDLFAYPYGAVDRECAAAVRRLWRWGLSCDDRVLGDSFDAARVPRLDVKAWETADFASRVCRLFEPAAPSRRRAFTLAP